MSDNSNSVSSRRDIPDALAKRAPEVDKRVEQRVPNPGVALDERLGTLRFTSPHDEEPIWRRQVADAFGSNSPSAAQLFLSQLAGLCARTWNRDRWEPDVLELNAILGIVNSVQPDNEVEAALAVQMVAVHLTTMKVATQALGGLVGDKPTAAIMARLATTYAMQCQTLDRLKGRRGRQEITVRYERHDHRHVHLEGGSPQNEDQPHAPRARRIRHPGNEPAHYGSPSVDAVGTQMHGTDAIG